MCGSAEVVHYLAAERGAQVNAPEPTLGAPLYGAAQRSNTTIVRLLLEHGADARISGGEHRTPLNFEAFFGHEDVLALLLSHAGLAPAAAGGADAKAANGASAESVEAAAETAPENGADAGADADTANEGGRDWRDGRGER